MLTLDAVMRLCVFCGTQQPADRVSAPTDNPTGSCEHCGTLAPSRNSPEQIAELVRTADPRQLRAERRRIINDSAEIEQKLDHVTGLNQEREDKLWNGKTALRAAFLASIGAIPVPLTFYTVWLDTWERETGRKAHAADHPFSESEFGENDHTETLYPRARCWLATIPFQQDEMLPLFGSQQLILFLPPTISAQFLQNINQRNMRQLGHSALQGLERRGRGLHTWFLTDKPHLPIAYTDVDELRSSRRHMRTLRRTWTQTRLDGGDSDTVTDTGELWPIEKVADFLGCSQSRARAILADRGITRISGYPATEVRQVQRRQGARTDLT